MTDHLGSTDLHSLSINVRIYLLFWLFFFIFSVEISGQPGFGSLIPFFSFDVDIATLAVRLGPLSPPLHYLTLPVDPVALFRIVGKPGRLGPELRLRDRLLPVPLPSFLGPRPRLPVVVHFELFAPRDVRVGLSC